MLSRRDFASGLFGGIAWFGSSRNVWAQMAADPLAGKPLPKWKPGEYQIHCIYTGLSESMFHIFPDGTSLLLDCGTVKPGTAPFPVESRLAGFKHPGERVAKYVKQVNPNGANVDYWMLSHYHGDHSGSAYYAAGSETRLGERYYLSGFSQAAEELQFRYGLDRCWPDYNDRPPPTSHNVPFVKSVYRWLEHKSSFRCETFRVGAQDQIRLLHEPNKYDFGVFNFCGNGRCATPEGTLFDLYQGDNSRIHNENGMSIGCIFRYGSFKLMSLGDFQDGYRIDNKGPRIEIEALAAKYAQAVSVCKLNHHGVRSMPKEFVKAVRAKVYLSCIWDAHQDTPDCMERICDRSLYPGERFVCPQLWPAVRREDAGDNRPVQKRKGKPHWKNGGDAWAADIAKESWEPAHVVVTVRDGGANYDVAFLETKDQSLQVRGVKHFKTV